jgi:hypothetical protein
VIFNTLSAHIFYRRISQHFETSPNAESLALRLTRPFLNLIVFNHLFLNSIVIFCRRPPQLAG